jgi:phosphopantetheine--protein transferase-like protein
VDPHLALRHIVATFLDLAPDKIAPDLPLAGARIQGSLARTRLAAAIQHQLGVRCNEVYSALTYGELQTAVCGSAETISPVRLSVPAPDHGQNGHRSLPVRLETEAHLSCGIDIEMVADLPIVQDYWEDPFYNTTFTAPEIAYCLMQANPSMHFAARWCAKEALKKCDALYNQIDLKYIEVALTTTGAPFLQCTANGIAERLPVAVSLSHTPQIAVATVVKSSPPTVPNGIAPLAAQPSMPKATSQRDANTPPIKSIPVPFWLSGLALVIALWAFARSW